MQTGLVGTTDTEITSGLAEGDEVVIALSTASTDHGRRRSAARGRVMSDAGGGHRQRRTDAPPVPHAAPVIDLRDVVKTYGEGETAVHAVAGVSLQVERGDYVAIMGASGSGKSTLMNIIGCLDLPTRGAYRLDGIDVRRLTDRSSRGCATARSASSSSPST